MAFFCFRLKLLGIFVLVLVPVNVSVLENSVLNSVRRTVHEDEHETRALFQGAHGFADDGTEASLRVAGAHGVARGRRAGQQVAGCDRAVLGARAHIDATGHRDQGVTLEHALLGQLQSGAHISGAGHDSGDTPVIGAAGRLERARVQRIDVGLTVFHLIERNAHLHGVSVGNAEGFAEMMNFVSEHGFVPVIDKSYAFEDSARALTDIVSGDHFGKLVIRI